jgi:hypothetical protein
LGLLAITLLAALITSRASPAAETSMAAEAQEVLQLSLDQRRRLSRGEIVSYPVTEGSEREVAAGLAMVVPVPASQLAHYLLSGQLIARDATIADFGPVPGEPPSGAVSPGFTAGERDEALALLDASPGTRFNLSLAEIEVLRAAKDSPGGLAEAASSAYRRLLFQRVQSYRQDGLAGIAPYARSGGGVTDPAVDLRFAAGDVEQLGRLAPDLREALASYPAVPSPSVESQVYWVKRRVQHRPHLSLLHRMVSSGPGPTMHLERYFYAGHSFNSMVILTGALAYQDGTMVFAITRVSTDEVLGIGSALKRTVARGQVRDEMRNRLERLRAAMARPAVTESP